MADGAVVRLLAEIKGGYPGFVWESELWAAGGGRRSPYRALVLFGLSPRTRDALLADMCRRFFRRFPVAADLAAVGGGVGDPGLGIVRPGQLPLVRSVAEAVASGVPRGREQLLRIKGVGGKVVECVLAYGWGEEALPLDVHGVRVLCRVLGLPGDALPGPLRQGLKCVYRRCARELVDAGIAMVDVHEILRLHGQLCCRRRLPACYRCPVSGCLSRRERQRQGAAAPEPAIWDEWRELLYEPAGI